MTKSELGGMRCRNDYWPHAAPIKHFGFFVDLFSALQNNGTGNLSVDLFHDLVRKIVSDLLSDLLSKYTHDVVLSVCQSTDVIYRRAGLS